MKISENIFLKTVLKIYCNFPKDTSLDHQSFFMKLLQQRNPKKEVLKRMSTENTVLIPIQNYSSKNPPRDESNFEA